MAVDMRYGFCFIIFQHFIFCILFFRARSTLASPAWGSMLCAKNQLKIHQIINKSTAQRNRQAGVKQ